MNNSFKFFLSYIDSFWLLPMSLCLTPLSLSLTMGQSYGMSSSPRGCALVLSNVTFDPRTAPDLDHRKGGEVDEEVLRKVFTELDFVVFMHRNLTAQVRPTHLVHSW